MGPMKRRRMVTHRMIAEEAGVSRSMVSLVLAGNDEASAATRERVKATARRLGYRPNLLVQGLRNNRTGTVGVIVPMFGFGMDLIRGIHLGLRAGGCLPILDYIQQPWWEPGAAAAELEVIHRMLDRRVDGIILLPVDESVESLYLKEVFDRGIPLVTVDRGIKSVSVDYVGTDEEQGGRLAAEHLLALGHRRLACVGASPRVANMVDRTEAFRRHAEAGGAVVEVLFADPMSGIHGPEIEAFFRLDPLPTAVMTASDNAAVKIMLHARERGLRLPQDLSIVGYADLEFARYLSPALTTIRQPFEAIGRAAAATVLAAAAPDATAKPLRLAPELVVRSSTAPRRG